MTLWSMKTPPMSPWGWSSHQHWPPTWTRRQQHGFSWKTSHITTFTHSFILLHKWIFMKPIDKPLWIVPSGKLKTPRLWCSPLNWVALLRITKPATTYIHNSQMMNKHISHRGILVTGFHEGMRDVGCVQYVIDNFLQFWPCITHLCLADRQILYVTGTASRTQRRRSEEIIMGILIVFQWGQAQFPIIKLI